MESIGRSPEFDDMIDALADVQRRKLLVALVERNARDDSPVAIADADSEAVAVEPLVRMNHVHLPKLADYGFIEWDPESHEATKGPNFDEIRPLLELLDNHEDELPTDWL